MTDQTRKPATDEVVPVKPGEHVERRKSERNMGDRKPAGVELPPADGNVGTKPVEAPKPAENPVRTV